MSQETGTARVKRGMAEMLKGGVIMDVVNAEQAKIAEDAGAVAVMALERVPADIRAQGGVARMSDPDMIEKIQATVSIPVMAKVRIGHFVEAQILESLGVDYIDESEVLTPADYINHVDKWKFKIPFVCGATNLGEALRRINEGAAMIRSKGEAGTGDVSNAMSHMRSIGGEIRRLSSMREDELYVAAKEMQAPYALVKEVAETGKLPVVLFTAGGIATPADAALMMQNTFPHINFRREVTVGHLLLDTDCACGVQAKVNPPIRPRPDVEALWDAVLNRDVDWIVSDHACCSAEQKWSAANPKNIWLAKSGFGGTEYLLSAVVSEGSKRGMSYNHMAELLAWNPAQRYGLPQKGDIAVGLDADLVLLDPHETFTVRAAESESKQGYTPFEGMELSGRVKSTFLRGELVYDQGKTVGPARGRYLRRPAAR